jgi:hypothetical protein
MAQLLSLPFRVSPAGQAVRVEQGDDEYYRQQVVTILLTLQGERPLNEDFGMPDMAFDGFMYSAFRSQLEQHLPEVEEVSVGIEPRDETTQLVNIKFTVLPEQI